MYNLKLSIAIRLFLCILYAIMKENIIKEGFYMNRSVIRTKKGIRKVFIEMLAEKKDVNKITVIELTERVGIVRSTFYAHYKDIDDVAKEIQEDFVTFISTIIDEYSNSSERNIAVPITKMFTFFDERKH